MSAQYDMVLSTLRALEQGGDLSGEGGVVANLLGIDDEETRQLLTAVAESADEDHLHHSAAVGFSIGLLLGEKIGFQRGVRWAAA